MKKSYIIIIITIIFALSIWLISNALDTERSKQASIGNIPPSTADIDIPTRNNICKLLHVDYVSTAKDGIRFTIKNSTITYIDDQYRNIFNFNITYDITKIFPDHKEGKTKTNILYKREIHKDTFGNDHSQLDVINIHRFSNNYLIIKNNNTYHIVNKAGIPIINKDFSYAEDFVDDLALVKDISGYNYINQDGDLLLPISLTDAKTFRNKRAIVADTTGYYVIDTKGNIKSKKYNFIDNFTKEYAVATKSNGNKTIINRDGIEISAILYDSILNYHEGYWIGIKAGLYSYFDNKGNPLKINVENPNTTINVAYPFRDGIALIQLNSTDPSIDNKYTYINTKGEQIIHKYFYNASEFSKNIASIALNENDYTYINHSGTRIDSKIYNRVYSFSDDKIALVRTKNKQYKYIDMYGKQINNKLYKDAYEFIGGKAQVVNQKDQWYLINTHGDKISSGYKYIDNFYDGIALVQKANGRYSYIDQSGHEISKKDFKTAFAYYSRLGRVVLDSGDIKYLTTSGEFFCK